MRPRIRLSLYRWFFWLLIALSACAVSAQNNIAPNGTGYVWHTMSSQTGVDNQTAAPGVNDGNLTVGVPAAPSPESSQNQYEAGGVIFPSAQSGITSVNFVNGTITSGGDGYFESNLALQTYNGSAWSNVSGWTLSPAYAYSSSVGGNTYTFSGPALSNVLGVRIVGMVRCSCHDWSWYWIVNEVQVFAGSSSPTKRLLAYYLSWSYGNTPAYPSSKIPYSELTHIFHASVDLTSAADGSLALAAGMPDSTLTTNAHNAGVKVLLTIGSGDGVQGPRFNTMARSEAHRQNFVANVRNLLTQYGYDGVDIDWEQPTTTDMSDCTTLMQELRAGLPSPWLISMATTADPTGTGYDIPSLTPYVDFFNVMTYDFYGNWEKTTGLVSPLYQDPNDPQQVGSVKTSMDLYQNTYGVPISKINIGTPFYGYEWDGTSSLWASCHCSSSKRGNPNYGPYIKPRINLQGWTNHTDANAGGTPYLSNTKIPGFITYDSATSTAAKVQYVIKTRGFGGVFMWELSGDYDGSSQDLLTAMYNAWK